MWCAFMGYASRCWLSLREALQHLTTVTGVLKTHVTGGALCAVALQRSGQHAHVLPRRQVTRAAILN